MHSVNIYKWGTTEKTDLPNIVRLQGHTRHYLCLQLSHNVSNYISSCESCRMKTRVQNMAEEKGWQQGLFSINFLYVIIWVTEP